MSDRSPTSSPPSRAVEATVELAGVHVPSSLMDADRELGQQADIVTAASAAVSGHAGPTGAHAVLPGVLADVPVAVLVIDQAANAVMYANVAAVELAGNISLPVDVDRWGAAAGLTDLTGAALATTSGPLSLVAQGRPLTGEAVRMAPGRSTEQARADADEGEDDELLWVTGFPLQQAGSGNQPLALVVFMKLDPAERISDPEAYLQALRERAVIATDITFTITDPRNDDNPLVWVNPSFTRITGYEIDEVVGRNCRFLQGPATDPATVEGIRAALRERRTHTTTLLNYRKDGSAFWNQLSLSPVFDGTGDLVSFVGVQTDVTERVRVEHEREAAFAAEKAARAIAEQARADAEHAQSRLALMAEATGALSATLDMTELLDRLRELCVPRLADWVVLTLVDQYGQVVETVARHRDGLEGDLAVITRHARHLPQLSPRRRSMSSARPVLLEDVTPELLLEITGEAEVVAAFQRLGGRSTLTVPMVARRRTLGTLALVRADAGTFSQDEIELVEDLAARAAMAMDNVRLYQQEHSVADTLQRSLLPELPAISGIESAAHYVSASTAADVGGDFYDLLHLPDGSVGLAVGDVVGHDVAAAAAMGQLRGVLRAVVWEAEDGDPGTVLARVDRLVQGLRVASLATMVYVRAERPVRAADPWRVHVANAGHPPLLLRHPSGEVELVDGVTGLLVGVDATAHRETLSLDVPSGSTLIGYTDGLIERPGLDMDHGIRALCERIAATPAAAGPRELCDAAVSGALDHRDDVALLAVRFG